MEPTRILFVDDEPRVLDGLRDMLRKYRRRWSMDFVIGGDLALAAIQRCNYDVVVCDLHMPRVDGVAVLKHLRDHHPQTVRIVLSGDPTRDSALRAIPFAHQSLTKPCRPGELETVLSRACRLREFVADENVRQVLGRLRGLPPLPRTYSRLLRILDDDRVGMNEVGELVANDIGLAAKLLQIVNSPFFGVGREITSVRAAVTMLGLETVKTLVLSTALTSSDKLPPPVRAFAEQLQAHSLLVADVAMKLAASDKERQDVYSAALLHDIGWMVFAVEMPEALDAYAASASGIAAPPGSELLTAAHSTLGGYLLGLWGLPLVVIDAVASHHGARADDSSSVARIVREAESLVDAVGGESTIDLETVRALARERGLDTGESRSRRPTQRIASPMLEQRFTKERFAPSKSEVPR